MMTIIRKSLSILCGLCISMLILAFLHSDLQAYTLDPASGNYEVGQVYTVTVLAQPGDPGNDTSSLVELARSNNNIAFRSADASSNGTLQSGVCPGGGSYSDSRVCFIYGDSTGINNGDTLGTFTFEVLSEGTVDININTSDAIYSASGETGSGSIGAYTLVQAGKGTPGTLPDTSITDIFTDATYLFMGTVLIAMGVLTLFINPVLIKRTVYRLVGRDISNSIFQQKLLSEDSK